MEETRGLETAEARNAPDIGSKVFDGDGGEVGTIGHVFSKREENSRILWNVKIDGLDNEGETEPRDIYLGQLTNAPEGVTQTTEQQANRGKNIWLLA